MYSSQTAAQERSNQPPPPPPPSSWAYPPPPPPPPPTSSQASTVSSQPPNGTHSTAYPLPTTLPPLSEHHRDMALSYQHPPPPPSAPAPPVYQYPPPHTMAPYTRPQDSRYAAHPHPYPPQHQPAPRQRTAIACRYCRRRKIRCSGFDSNEDGRCTNCSRFSQECVFTPVSAQTQAFVPAHAVYSRGGPQPTQLYGAYGQPLPPPQTGQDPYARPPPHYTLPSPTGPYSAAPPPPAVYPAPFDDRSGINGTGRKRQANEPHTPTLPPPNPASTAALPRTMGLDYRYPDPTASAEIKPDLGASQHGHAYYASQQPPRRSPSSLASPYPNATETSRASSSPHTTAAPSTPGTATYPYPPETGLQPPQSTLPVRVDGRTPPPPATSTPGSGSAASTAPTTNGHQQGVGRPAMSISSIVSGDGSSPGTRSTTDSAMLKKLGK